MPGPVLRDDGDHGRGGDGADAVRDGGGGWEVGVSEGGGESGGEQYPPAEYGCEGED